MNIDKLRLKRRDGFPDGLMIRFFQRFEFRVGADQRVAKRAVEFQTPLDFASSLFVADAVNRGQHVQLMASCGERLDQRLAAEIVSSGVVGWIQAAQNKNLHGWHGSVGGACKSVNPS